MNLATAVSAANQIVGAHAAHTEQWATKWNQCCDETAKQEHWLYSIFCPFCAAAHAKAKADKSHPVFNFFCFMPVGNISMVRHHYNIMGECGEDMLYGWFCMPCVVRRAWTEANIRGPLAGRFGENQGTWSAELTQCDFAEFCKAAFCPCIVAHEVRQLMQPKADKWFDCLCMIPFSMYGQVRHTYGITSEWPHPTCEDILMGLFCYPCALNRALREAAFQKTRAATSSVAGMAQQKMAAVQQAGSAVLGKMQNFGNNVKGKANNAMK